MAFSVAVMAGGQSSRMGRDKAFVTVGGRPLIEHVLARVSDLGQVETFIVGPHTPGYVALGLPLVNDLQPGAGPLGGIFTALSVAQTEQVVIVACDVPFVSAGLVVQMVAWMATGEWDVVVPRVGGRPQALVAVYSNACRVVIAAALQRGVRKVTAFYEHVRVRYVDEAEIAVHDRDGVGFMNLNTPADVAQAERWMMKKQGDL